MELRTEAYVPGDESIRVGRFDVGMEWHSHEFIEIVYFNSGPGIHEIDGVEYPVEEGDVFLINPHVNHYYRSVNGNEHLSVYNCLFPPSVMLGVADIDNDDFIESIHRLLLRDIDPQEYRGFLSVKSDGEFLFKNMFYDMNNEYTWRKQGYQKVLHSQLVILLVQMFRQIKSNIGSRFRVGLIAEVVEKINAKTNRKITVRDLAKELYVSESYLSRMFKKETNMNLVQYIQNRKLQKACELLTQTDMSIDNIIESVGYTDKKFFYQLFFSKMNETPGSYRKRTSGARKTEDEE